MTGSDATLADQITHGVDDLYSHTTDIHGQCERGK